MDFREKKTRKFRGSTNDIFETIGGLFKKGPNKESITLLIQAMCYKPEGRVRLTDLPPSVSRLSRENVGASASHDPMGLHSLLQD
jgi:hypothetical protein